MVFHRTFRQQHITDEQVALKDGSTGCREGGAGDGEVLAHGVEQGIGNGPDVALIS